MNQMDTMKLRESLLDENQWYVKVATMSEVHMAHMQIQVARVVATVDRLDVTTCTAAAPLRFVLIAMKAYDAAFEKKFMRFIADFMVKSLVSGDCGFIQFEEG